MVSFQSPFSEAELLNNQTKIVSGPQTDSKKRKCHDDAEADEILPCKYSTAAKSFSDVEFHLGTPLPSEWQRCLDIQSGAIHFYNTRTHKRTLRDPRASPEPSTPRDYGHMSLDLELNLPCGSPTCGKPNPMMNKKSSKSTVCATYLFMGASSEEKSSSSETPEADQAMEMVATVCMKCHMLVMLCKLSPTCPNCKFMHPPYQTSANQNVELASLEVEHTVIQGMV